MSETLITNSSDARLGGEGGGKVREERGG